MNEVVGTSAGYFLPSALMIPVVHKIGSRDIEFTYLGQNISGHPTWILWNRSDPYLIGILNQTGLGYTFEQRTSAGVLVQKHVTLEKVQRAISS